MRSDEIRRNFLDFWSDRDHRVWPSSSLIPNDPTVFLTVAGMVQFKPFFLGEAAPELPRATSVQKVVRIRGKLDDIDIVGRTTRHLTFFEMLGNFSFGDYFKADAIRWAWELSTSGFGFDPDRIWVSVYTDDDEAAELWTSEAGVPGERVVRRGRADNFWTMGGAGPCGPCSELFYDRGPDHGSPGGPEVDESRYLEFWNLVFMQYEQDDDGNILGELPRRNVDTGLGLERLAMLLQDVPNVYETDVIRPLLERASEVTGVAYGQDDERDVSLRVIADHARSTSFLIADGVLPSNEGRGYVLRRLLRRMVHHSRLLSPAQPEIMPAMTDIVRSTLAPAWPELEQQAELIRRSTAAEEEGFSRTLRSGLAMLDEAIGQAKAAGDEALPAKTAFTLHDTYGFPVDLTLEIAADHGLDLDRDAFAAFMEGQRARARAAGKGMTGEAGVPVERYREAADRTGATTFLGYTDSEADSRIGALVTAAELRESAEEGDEVEVVLPRTPFYAEGGGQLGDHGLITTDTGRLEVLDTVSPVEGMIVHRARVAAGEVRAGQDAHAAIDTARRASITRGHTATHLLHATLREVVGEHAAQAGSAIDAGRFRFDFPHFSAVRTDQLAELEQRVNDRIAADPGIATVETTQAQARAMGATALFGEKYGERVRVVRIGDFSAELCGGTHVGRTTEVGLFTILSEGSIAANLRRIEAVTGPEALGYLSRERLVAEQVARLLKVGTDEVVERVTGLVERLRAAEKDLARARQASLLASAPALVEGAERVDGAGIVAATVPGADRDSLKALALDLRNRLGRGIVVLGSPAEDGKAQLIAAVSADLAKAGVQAAEVLRPGAQMVGGGAGGRGGGAQAGGRDGGKLD
ncbi:MAG: alanine--tRNA ligase, partial [Egibacteraceae bacterium]